MTKTFALCAARQSTIKPFGKGMYAVVDRVLLAPDLCDNPSARMPAEKTRALTVDVCACKRTVRQPATSPPHLRETRTGLARPFRARQLSALVLDIKVGREVDNFHHHGGQRRLEEEEKVEGPSEVRRG